jgi:hypothetical protein
MRVVAPDAGNAEVERSFGLGSPEQAPDDLFDKWVWTLERDVQLQATHAPQMPRDGLHARIHGP